jgi:VWFA-related protein
MAPSPYIISRYAGIAGFVLGTMPLLNPAFAQTNDKAPEPSEFVIKKIIRLVEVDVIATDTKGKRVSGLKREDFALTDNGSPEKISFFSDQDAGNPMVAPQAERFASPPATGTLFTNDHPSAAPPIVLLMDLLNTPVENQTAAKNAIIAALRQISPPTPTALLILGEELKLVGDFTTDASSLASLLDKPSVSAREGSSPDISAPPSSHQTFNYMILRSAVNAFRQENDARVDKTLRALNLICRQLSGMRGRKSLIWVGGGLDVAEQDGDVTQDLIRRFNDANTAVYTVDAHGVLMDFGISADNDSNDLLGPRKRQQAEARGAILEEFARRTGGLPYRNTNALDTAIVQAAQDSRSVYTLGYYPLKNSKEGGSHKIQVNVARSGVTLRYRSTYVETAAPPTESPDNQTMLNEVAASSTEFPGLRFSVAAAPGNDSAAESFTLQVPAREIRLAFVNGEFMGALGLWFIQKQANGQELARKASNFSFHLTAKEYEAFLSQGLNLKYVLPLEKTAAQVRLLLRDAISGNVGTVDVAVNLK